MNIVRLAAIVLTACLAGGCASSPQPGLSAAELAEVLDIQAWRIPEPPKDHEWSLEVVRTVAPQPAGAIERGAALITMRPVSEDAFEFIIKQRGTKSSGTFTPCKEPENSVSICDGYSLKWSRRPECAGSCTSAVLGELSAMVDDSEKRWIVLIATPSLRIEPNERTRVTPVQ